MKKIILIFLSIIALDSQAAILSCVTNGIDEDWNHHFGLSSRVNGTCVSKHQKNYKFEIAGFGPGVQIFKDEIFILTCPTARLKNITKHAFFGIELSASALIAGANAGIISNKNGGVCVVTGLNFLGIGASVKGVKLKITNKKNY